MYPLRRVGGACNNAVYGEYKVRLWERKGRLHFLDVQSLTATGVSVSGSAAIIARTLRGAREDARTECLHVGT